MPERANPGSPNALVCFLAVLSSPGRAFAAVLASPRWAPSLALATLIPVASLAFYLSFDVGRQALIDREVDRMEYFGLTMAPDRYESLLRDPMSLVWRDLGLLAAGIPAAALALAGIAGRVRGGGDLAYGTRLAIVTHAGAVLALRAVALLPFWFRSESFANPLSVAALLPFAGRASLLSRALGGIDLFAIWGLGLLGLGLGRATGRSVRPFVLGLLGVYAAFAGVIAALGAWQGGI